MVKELSPHIKDLIIAYQTMPQTVRRDLIITALKRAYMYATSDELKDVTKGKSMEAKIGAHVIYKHEDGTTSPARITNIDRDAVTLTVHTLDGDTPGVISLNQAPNAKKAKVHNWYYPEQIKA